MDVPIIILDDISFLAYCEQIEGAKEDSYICVPGKDITFGAPRELKEGALIRLTFMSIRVERSAV